MKFLVLECCISATEANKRLLWATKRVVERIVLEVCDSAWAWVDDKEAKAPGWLHELTDRATALLDSDPDDRKRAEVDPVYVYIDRDDELAMAKQPPEPARRPSLLPK